MRKVSRKDCVILPLVLKKRWYDMIASGVKKEEYREYKPFWIKRIENWQDAVFDGDISGKKRLVDVVAFSCGYRKPDMFFKCNALFVRNAACFPQCGEPPIRHFAIALGERVELVD